ncbi:MAG: APC family permease [Thermoleophilia bacterium]|nr:APC family permease [Thermoleophilia bacterium]
MRTDGATEARGQAAEAPGLKANSIRFVDGLSIGLASTAPAYSLAAVIGSVAVIVGLQAPAAMLTSFIPMFLIAAAFFYMNRADPDAGTTFSWVTRTLGPYAGWIGGWAVCTTGILVIGSLADVGARYFYELIGAEGAAGSRIAVTALACAVIVVMTAICVIGTELSARLQNVLTLGQVAALLIFATVALVKVYTGNAPEGAVKPEASWFSPFAVADFSSLVSALLLGVFIYWGWESAVNLAEETADSTRAPGLAAIVSTVVLLVTYLGVSTAVVAFAGLDVLAEFDDDEAVFSALGTEVLGSPWEKIVVLAIVISAISSTQTTIIPASRTTFSMGRASALPHLFASIHPRFRTPHLSTIIVAALAILWYVPANFASENFFFDTLSALSLLIAFYYALSGLACAVYYRRELLRSVTSFLFIGVAPVVGAGLLLWLFVRSVIDLTDPANSYTGTSWLGVGPPLVIGIGFLLLGIVFEVSWRLRGNQRYFGRKAFEAVDPEVAAGRVRVAAEEI